MEGVWLFALVRVDYGLSNIEMIMTLETPTFISVLWCIISEPSFRCGHASSGELGPPHLRPSKHCQTAKDSGAKSRPVFNDVAWQRTLICLVPTNGVPV